MPRTPQFRLGLVIVLTVILGCANPRHSPPQRNIAAEPEKQIHLEDLKPESVIGRLGFPLGTIITIEGTVEDLSDSHMKADDGRTSLMILTVNGQPLSKSVRYDFIPTRTKKGRLSTPPANAKFIYIGYEKANFYGQPKEAEKYLPPITVATNRIGFRCDAGFVVLDDLLYPVEHKPEPDPVPGPVPSY